MKLLLTLTFFLNLAHANNILCENNNCREVEYGKPGSSLLNFDEVKPAKKEVQNENYAQVESKDQYNDLKWSDIRVGGCYIDPKGMNFYKVLNADKKSGKVRFVIERKNHDYDLKVSTIFWKQMGTTKGFRQLKKWSCGRTPNLGNSSYVNKCVANSSFANHLLCDPPKQF